MREIFLDSHFLFKRAALVENGKLQALAVEPLIREPLEGAIFLGRITAVVASLDAAFVDIGLDQEAFLPLKDLPERFLEKRLKNGMELLVQLKSEGGRYKGPKATGKIELQGRYLVLMPEMKQKSVSKKLRDPEKRQTLMTLVNASVGDLGYIIRTEGALAETDVVVEEARRLKVAWDQLQRTYVTVMQPQCVDPGLSAIQRLLLRQLTVPGTVLTLADPEEAGEWVPFFKDYQIEAGLAALKPSREKKRDPFLFERTHQLESQIQSLLNPRVEFGGAYLIMEPTEAFMAVDVNAGSAASGARLTADLKRKINQEAILECLRQLELRNVGGMVMMDLIDAEGEAERHYYHAFLKKILQSSFSGVFSAEVSSLGVLSLTRRRMGSSLAELLLSPCGCCGQGHVLSAASQLDLMLKEAIRSGPGEKAFQVSRPVAALMERLQSVLLKVEQDFEIHLRWEIDESLNHLPNQYKKNL